MDKNMMIIFALIVVIAALLLGIGFTMMPNMNKLDTNLKFNSSSTLTEGDSLKIILTDANGTAIANKTVNITVTDNDGTSDYHSVVTNENGTGNLKLDKSPGNYNVTISYGGNDKYNGCNASEKITIEEEVVEYPSYTTQSEQIDYNSRNSKYFKSDVDGSYHEMQEGADYVYAQML